MYIQIGICTGLLLFFLLTRKEKTKRKTSWWNAVFLKGGRFLERTAFHRWKLEEQMLALFLAVVCAGNLLGLWVSLGEWREQESQQEAYLPRNSYGEGDYTQDIEFQIEGEAKKREITVQVEEQQYKKEEIQEFFDDALAHMEENILGKNESLEEIRYPLQLITALPESPIQISWMTDDPQILDWEGHLGAAIPEQGVDVLLTAELLLGEESAVYQRQVKVYPEILSEEEALSQKAAAEIDRINEEDSQDKLYLPETIDGKKVIWSQISSHTGIYIACLSIFAAVLLLLRDVKAKEEDRRRKQEQMLLDYPDVVSKMVLLLGAGMTIRNALYKIAVDYQQFQSGYSASKRYAYDEIVTVCQQMEGGMAELEAYQRLAARLEIAKYKTFAVLLSQNLRRGSKGLLALLEREAAEALEDRKRNAKIAGEQAVTKLLVPMLLMLLVVLIILMVPAGLTMTA